MTKFDGLIFDLDGTLWDSSATVAEAWSAALARLGIKKTLSRDDLTREMGKPMDVIMADFFPDLTEEKRNALMPELCDEETKLLTVKGGALYPDVPETLSILRERYRLFIVSNCQRGYIESFLAAHSFGNIFEGHLCWGDTGLTKGGTNRELIRRYGLKSPIYIGDTEGDRLSAVEAEIPFLYAAYGFGEVTEECPRVGKFAELPSALDALEA
ncbi:MAG: HAD family hydrolase [Bacteroides sp.]|nr:HAD family hydrolase [Eubacterium sp.]MCM1418694.1 HAD family hydrolase [Roseburia sp.]MCM1462722.1 HAD family hydrolase [Bacteroides sp.]